MIARLMRAGVKRLLPPHVRDVVLRDLDDEYRLHIRRSSGRIAARLWLIRQLAGSVRPALEMRRSRRLVKEESRMRPGLWFPAFVSDTRFGLRMLARHRSFAAAAVSTLALAIAATTTVWAVVDTVLLRPLPYRDQDQLVRVWSNNPRGIARNSVSPADFFDWQEQGSGIQLAAFVVDDATLTSGGDATLMSVANATDTLAPLLGVEPLAGRWFTRQESAGSGGDVVVLSEHLWRTRFSADPGIVGHSLTFDGAPRTVVGIMPASFALPDSEQDAWLPLPDVWRSQSRSAHYLVVVGRLAPGVAMDAAAERMGLVASRLATAYPSTNRGWGVTIASLRDSISGSSRTALSLILAAVIALLLIASANVGGLLLARGIARRREFLVRAAIGASRGRLLRQQAAEALLLAVLGCGAGLALTDWAIAAARVSLATTLPLVDRMTLDLRVVMGAAVAALLAALAAGVLPIWRASRLWDASALNAGDRIEAGHLRVRHVLLFIQVAAATVLLVGGGLLTRSLVRLTGVSPGFDPSAHALIATVSLPANRYASDARAAFFDRVLQHLRVRPGVRAAGAGGPLPLSGQDGLWRFGLLVDGHPPDPAKPDRAYLRWATPGYLEAIGVPLRAGRTFTDSDRRDSARVALIDDVLARRLFAGADPIGRRVATSNDREWRTVIGVVGSVRQTALDRESEPHVYVPETQLPSTSLTIVVRADGDPRRLTPELRDAVAAQDPAIALANVRSLGDLFAGSVDVRRFNALALALLAGAALVLAMIGIYGLVASTVAQSTREVGIRLALGAPDAAVLGSLVGRTVRLVVLATGVGLAIAVSVAPLLGSLLFGVEPRDPLTLGASAAALVSTALCASYLPARRALRFDVVHVLRQ